MSKRPWIDLRELREEKNWTQDEAGEKLGFSRCYLSTVERGKRNISKAMMRQIILVFNVKYEDFYNEMR